MALFWFFAGVLTTLAVLVVSSPLLRSSPRFASLPAVPWQGSVVAIVIVATFFASYGRLVHPGAPETPAATASAAPTPAADSAAATPMVAAAAAGSGNFGTAAKVFGEATGASVGGGAMPAPKAGAGSMESAVAALEARLAKGGGSPDDWELLAKSFEFLGRPADAAKARAKQLPPLVADAKSAPASPAAVAAASESAAPVAAGGAAVKGEVTLAAALAGKAAAGETLFIVAKSVDQPGIPVAVFRGSVGTWPLKFTLDDSQAMMPGRNLSSAGRVTIEARISLKGQPLPAAGDLQGSSGIIDPSNRQPLKITIDRVIT
jgi:hypothetical protein